MSWYVRAVLVWKGLSFAQGPLERGALVYNQTMRSYTLPLPPSVNAMYRRGRGYGIYKTKEAKLWIESCKEIIKKKQPYKNEVDVSVNFYFKRTNCDIDSRLKALLDVLEDCCVYENDRQIYSLLVNKYIDKQNPRVEITITPNP